MNIREFFKVTANGEGVDDATANTVSVVGFERDPRPGCGPEGEVTVSISVYGVADGSIVHVDVDTMELVVAKARAAQKLVGDPNA